MRLLICFTLLSFALKSVRSNDKNVFSNTWAVHIADGKQTADTLAHKHGFKNLGEILPNIYLFEHQRISKRSLSPSLEHHDNLVGEPEV